MLTEQLVKSLLRALKRSALLVIVSATLICILVLCVGFFWPKKFHSHTSIYADKKNIIRPLLEGVAQNTEILNQADAKELIFSRNIMQKILESGGWTKVSLTPVQQEMFIEAIKGRTLVSFPGQNILRIDYSDDRADRAHQVVSKYAELFLEATVNNKKMESEQAYNFIDNQVKVYHQKLQQAEDNLKQFRTQNVDNRAGGQVQAFSRIDDLRKELEITTLQWKEAKIRRDSLSKQLQTEVTTSEQADTGSFYQNKVRELQQQIDLLRLTFHDTYPDIVRLKQQIVDVRQLIAAAENNPNINDKISYKALQNSVYYQKLRGELAQADTAIALNATRIAELKGIIASSRDRVAMMSESQAAESELIRDYEVNKDLYQSLLRKREYARVSMNMDIEGRGLTFKIQEPANFPLLPSGLRFVHFLILAPVIALGIPLGLLFAFIYLDPRVRSTESIAQGIQVPILMAIPPAATEKNASHDLHNNGLASKGLPALVLIFFCVLLVVATYVVLIWAKLNNFVPFALGT